METESQALEFIKFVGWNYRDGGDQAAVETCPFCSKSNFKFYVNITGGDKDGMFDCKHGSCAVSGNFRQLKEACGFRVMNTTSMKDAANSRQGPEPLPNFDELHKNLLEVEAYAEVLEYITGERGFTLDVIQRLKLGAMAKSSKLWYVIPYFSATGEPIYYKARTVPPAAKDFYSPKGREAPLYNEQCVKPNMDHLIITEGEADCIAMLCKGVDNVVGVPGATVKKAVWIDKLDKMRPQTIYLLYDRDDAGQKNAKDMAVRIGLDRCKNILLPEFGGKDVNEWFQAGNTLVDFAELMANAKPFDVEGVQNVESLLAEIERDLDTRGSLAPTYLTPWADLNERFGGAEDGDLVGVMAEAKVGKTTTVLNWLHWLSQDCGHNTLMFCNEMMPKRMVRKWASMATGTEDSPTDSKFTKDTIREALDVAAAMKGDILFAYEPTCKADTIFDIIRQAVRRYGVKVVCFDNLQMLVRSVEHATYETAKYIAQFKALAMELNIFIILIIQPHRVAEGQIVSARNAANSAQIEKFVDSMICLHRRRQAQIKDKDFQGYLETDENFEPAMLCRVDLSRYSAGGCCTLFMDGSRSTVRSWTTEDQSTVEIDQTKGLIPVEEVVAA